MTFKTQLTDKWSVSGELAGAKNNFSKPRVTPKEPFIVSGNGQDNHAYQLPNTALVEDSELVFLNDILQIKDEHYTINYVRGTVRFRDQTPQQHDQIKVFYDYFSTSSLTEQGEETELKLATKVETSYLGDKIQTGFNVKHVDREFLPIAPIGEKRER